MTKNELITLMRNLQLVFDIVRLVDLSMKVQTVLNDDDSLSSEPYNCYAVWSKQRRCENCISSKALIRKEKMTKFEFVDNDVYHVTAMYVELDSHPYVLEMVSKITDETLFGAYGKDKFISTITEYNEKLYIDPLTGAYNRRYFVDHLDKLLTTAALIDVDHFKEINDTYGHEAGDEALKTAASVIMSKIHSTDALIRYGGDEFLLAMHDICYDDFKNILEDIRIAVNNAVLEKYPDIKLSVSIGGSFAKHEDADIISHADTVLYKAKNGRNKSEVCFIDN